MILSICIRCHVLLQWLPVVATELSHGHFG